MAGLALTALPEALLTVAEKTLGDSRPLLWGLSAQQLSRLAREVYVHLMNRGKVALAQQAQALTDPLALAKAVQILQGTGKQGDAAAACPCCSAGPLACTHKAHGALQQPQVVPIVLQQQPWPLQQQQQQPLQQQLPEQQLPRPLQQQQQQQPLKQQLPEPAQLCLADGSQATSPAAAAAAAVATDAADAGLEREQRQQTTSRKACVARLILALVAAKLLRDLLAAQRSNSSSSSSKKMNRAAGAAAEGGGLGAVPVDSLAESLAPRSGLFAGLPGELLQSLQQLVAAALDGAAAAAAAAGYGPSSEGKRGKASELPPLYLENAQQGRTQLTEHEQQASALINELLQLPGARTLESLRAGMLEGQQQQQPPPQQQQQPQQQSQQQQHQREGGVMKGAAANATDEGEALDAAFKAFVRRAEEHKGPSPLSIEQLLRFYGLYKRATSGPCTEKQPSRFNLKQYKKWEAWKACDKLSALEAKREYVKLAKQLETMQARL
ncbi:hypothetical protein Efla_003751 [Eimeria flavescens]